MSNLVNEFILRRTNTLNAQHLPPKLVQVRFLRRRMLLVIRQADSLLAFDGFRWSAAG